ncbi:hypothetical protein [Amycolatopsis taiwanensis]|uniref:Uncharacterized protein n=1 Tax=Amycolatopsis taiwanensis TaxID=342230 RepID=A0A9W6R7U2_9PSEU|nr:hypothetical protein [Amycolatopsis taiwanensis]GLY70863.1 hypothetical protein Atai01_74820 [Amycolatopsis taiwanensis]
MLRELAQNHDSPWASSLADALRLSRWHEVAPQLIETAPEVLTVITDELAIISRADAV